MAVSELLRGEREPLEEAYSPTASSAVSDVGTESADEESEYEDDDSILDDASSIHSRQLHDGTDHFAMLQDLVSARSQAGPSIQFMQVQSSDTMSLASAWQEPEMQQLRRTINDIITHLYRLATFIRRPVPQDRLKRSARINVDHFKPFDDRFVNDCFPAAAEWLRGRLAKAITRRRQTLIYNRKHHQRLSHAHPKDKPVFLRVPTNEELVHGGFTAPATVVAGTYKIQEATQIGINPGPVSTRIASTRATDFVHGATNGDEDAPDREHDVLSLSSAGTLLATHDSIHIPPRPRGADGSRLDEFECPYCYRIQNIQSDGGWK